ncbi:MAG: hypothetical protein H6740_09645 [Alphaproteobacteria bacterium]|nr:hypothetical protein [Alphaproteobacteria bacterium]
MRAAMLSVLLPIACSGKSVVGMDSGDTASRDEAFHGIQSVELDCDGERWTASTQLSAWLYMDSSAYLYMARSGDGPEGALEVHPFPPTEEYTGQGDTRGTWDPDGGWEHLYMELAAGVAEPGYNPGEESERSCSELERLTFSVFVHLHDELGTDCVTFGAEPGFVHEGYDFSACRPL